MNLIYLISLFNLLKYVKFFGLVTAKPKTALQHILDAENFHYYDRNFLLQ